MAEADKNEVKESWDHPVPWPGNSYMIIEKATGRAIYDSGDDLWLDDGEATGEVPATIAGNTLLCVEEYNNFLFFNKSTCRYIGCLNINEEPALIEASPLAQELASFRFMARAHPQGGYKLLLHEGDGDLHGVAVRQDNSHVHARQHGPTLWEFRKVSCN